MLLLLFENMWQEVYSCVSWALQKNEKNLLSGIVIQEFKQANYCYHLLSVEMPCPSTRLGTTRVGEGAWHVLHSQNSQGAPCG
jgi:hypothetical protein